MPPGGRGRGRGQGNWGPPGGEMTFSIPTHKCGLVIGRGECGPLRPAPCPLFPGPSLQATFTFCVSAGGENVKAINQQTGAFVEISRQLPPNGDPNFKLFIIRGSPQQIDHAKQLIEEKIEVGWGGLWGFGLTARIPAHLPWLLSFLLGSSLPSWTRPRWPRPCWPNGALQSWALQPGATRGSPPVSILLCLLGFEAGGLLSWQEE